MDSFFNYIISQKSKILELLIQHMNLTLIAILLAIVVGIPLGILISRVKSLKKYILGFVNIVQSIPSMALLGLVIPILGIGSKPTILMVVLYSLLPIVKNTYIGVTSIDPVILESARGIGLTKKQTLFKIQLPLALPVIMGGVRISAVTAVGLMTLAAFIGGGGLGYLVFSGVQTVNNNMILAGAIPSCILALLVDYVFGKIELLVTPNGLNLKNEKKNFTGLKVVTAVIVVMFIFMGTSSFTSGKKETITIGCKSYTEQLILGNMYADLIEDKTDYNVDRKFGLNGSIVAFQAITNGEIDLYPDYTGTILMNIMNEEAIKDPKESYNAVQTWLQEKHNLTMIGDLGFNNTYTLSMMPELAEKLNINTISDLENYSKDLVFSPTMEFENREDGYVGMSKVYDIPFKEIKAMDGSLRYTALKNNECQVVDAFLTDGLIKKFNIKILEDDKNFFVPYYAVPVIRQEVLEKYPDLEGVIKLLDGQIDEETMTDLNYQVDELGKDPKDVAYEFLEKREIIKSK